MTRSATTKAIARCVVSRFSQIATGVNRTSSDAGGVEEFLLVAPGLDLEHARTAAERLRGLIESSGNENHTRVTASFGVSEYRMGDDVASLVKRADEALIEAKQSGRNRVIAWTG
jgi:diguanylate cyclase (GGDEF)-like protein